VSVVIPTRDRLPMLETNALASALGQEDVALEVVVVDDGSRDGTTARLRALDEPRLVLVRHDEPRGVAGARNAGLARARAPWIAFLDDDDLWSPRKLRTQLDLAAASGADFVFAGAVLVDASRAVLDADVEPSAADLAARLLDGNVVPGGCSNVLARTALVRELGGFDERLGYTEDWDLWIRLARAGSAAATAEVLVAHVEHAGSALFRYRPDVVGEVELVRRKHGAAASPEEARARRRGLEAWLAEEYERGGLRSKAVRVHLAAARTQRSLRPLLAAARVLVGARRRSARAVPAPDWLHAA